MKKFLYSFFCVFLLALSACSEPEEPIQDVPQIQEEEEQIDDVTTEEEDITDYYDNVFDMLSDYVEFLNTEDPDLDAFYDYYQADNLITLYVTDTTSSYDDYYAELIYPGAVDAALSELKESFDETIIKSVRKLFDGAFTIVISSNDGLDILYFSASSSSNEIDYMECLIIPSDDQLDNSNVDIQPEIPDFDYYVYPVGNTCYWDNVDPNYITIGTLTFYDPTTGIYGAFGHPAEEISLQGLSYDALVREVTIKRDYDESGVFEDYYQGITDIEYNDRMIIGDTFINDGLYGVYGNYNSRVGGWVNELMEVGWKGEVHTGPAVIYSEVPNMSDDDIWVYQIEITAVYYDCFDFVITDQKMISSGIGIAEGMSGTPIIQDNKIIGALSGMYLTDDDIETVGYAVYMEDMLYEAGIIQ